MAANSKPGKKPKKWASTVFAGSSGTADFKRQDLDRVLDLMSRQGCAIRSAYQARTEGDSGDQLRNRLKAQKHGGLGLRYLDAAISKAGQLPTEEGKSVVFGGKKNWKRLVSGEISRDQWHHLRNRRLYSRGDRSKKGNPLIRVDGDTITVLIPGEKGRRGTLVQGHVKLHQPFPDEAKACYSVELIHLKGRKFQVEIGWGKKLPKAAPAKGIVSVDTNPDFLAITELDECGNLVGGTASRCQG
jgi:hypothetical protein